MIEDRGFLDGQTLGHLKGERGVDVIIPLKLNMQAYSEAVSLAKMERQWGRIRRGATNRLPLCVGLIMCGMSAKWRLMRVSSGSTIDASAPLNYIVLVTTDLKLSAQWMVRHYEERPEIEQDYQQLKSGAWHLQKLSSTRYTEIVWYVLTVVLSYNLYQLFANTQAGSRFASKTRQAIALEQLKTHRTHVIVYAGGYFEIFETLAFVRLVLQLSLEVQTRLRRWLDEHLDSVKMQE